MKNYSVLLLGCTFLTLMFSSCEKEPLPSDDSATVIDISASGEEDVPIDDKKD